jgi:hypothetical protein
MPRSKPECEQFWRRCLAEQRASGLSIRAYCQGRSLNEHSFYSWRRTIAQRDRQSAPAFLPVAVVSTPGQSPHSPIDIGLADGRRIRVRSGCDRALLADVLAILHAAPKEARPC